MIRKGSKGVYFILIELFIYYRYLINILEIENNKLNLYCLGNSDQVS